MQIISERKTDLQTVVIKELKEGHTASYLQSVLLKVLF